MTKSKYGIIGWPVKHSRSPHMQMSAFNKLGINAQYDLIPTNPNDLKSTVGNLVSEGYSGWNVTVPHKTNIIDYLDEIQTAARVSGSVNAVSVRNGKLWGFSTDGYGLEMSIKESFDINIEGGKFLFWGSGGAAAAAGAHFVNAGAAEIMLVNRTISKAQALKQRLNEFNGDTKITVEQPDQHAALKTLIERVSVVIQSTSVGLNVDDPISIPLELLGESLCLVDMIYSETTLLKEAKKMGCNVVDGKGMLLHQGAKSFEIWTGKTAPVDVMRQALSAG